MNKNLLFQKNVVMLLIAGVSEPVKLVKTKFPMMARDDIVKWVDRSMQELGGLREVHFVERALIQNGERLSCL